MKAYVVIVNGKRLFTAGVGPRGVLTALLSWVGRGTLRSVENDFYFHVGGIDSRTDEHLEYDTPALKVGDSVLIKIIEAESVDPEAERYVPACRLGTGRSKKPVKKTSTARRGKR